VEAIGANADFNRISDNVVTNNYSRGITIRGGSGGLSTTGNAVTHNIVKQNDIGVYVDTAGKRGSVIDRTVIEDNEIVDNKSHGIRLFDSGGSMVVGTTVRGNTIGGRRGTAIVISGDGVKNSNLEKNVIQEAK
jgi:parallel beta-helix repeat protein